MIIKLFEFFIMDENIENVKDLILDKAADTHNIEIIDFFIKRGYDINSYDAVFNSLFDKETLKYFIENGAELENFTDHYQFKTKLSELEVQKALIDLDKEFFIYSTVGFNPRLANDPKYADIIDRVESMGKFNI